MIANQVWAREEWNTGAMGWDEEKTVNMIFSTFRAHPSIFPTFHVAGIRALSQKGV